MITESLACDTAGELCRTHGRPWRNCGPTNTASSVAAHLFVEYDAPNVVADLDLVARHLYQGQPLDKDGDAAWVRICDALRATSLQR